MNDDHMTLRSDVLGLFIIVEHVRRDVKRLVGVKGQEKWRDQQSHTGESRYPEHSLDWTPGLHTTGDPARRMCGGPAFAGVTSRKEVQCFRKASCANRPAPTMPRSWSSLETT